MARPAQKRFDLIPKLHQGYGEVITRWKRVLTTGKQVTIEVTSTISTGTAHVYLDEQSCEALIASSKLDHTVILDDYEGAFECYKHGPLTVACLESDDMTSQESKEVYRSIYKWDLVYRDKSSDSESESGSEPDQEKIQRHMWVCCGEEHRLVGGFTISA